MGTITKALSLLNYFSENVSELGLADFTRHAAQDKATVHRHLSELLLNGYLEQNPETRKYRLGGSILRLASIREKTFPMRRILSQWVDALALDVRELVHGSVIQKSQMSPLYAKDASSGATRVNFSEAETLPFHATASGLAALAFGDPALLENLSKKNLKAFTNTTAVEIEDLKTVVEEVRKNGFAFSNQTYEDDVCSFAVPFFEQGPYAYGTIAIAIPASRFKMSDKKRFTQGLWKTAIGITREIGGSFPQAIINASDIAA
jgi:DNA-binding IclR family transcriptional regulator